MFTTTEDLQERSYKQSFYLKAKENCLATQQGRLKHKKKSFKSLYAFIINKKKKELQSTDDVDIVAVKMYTGFRCLFKYFKINTPACKM